MGGAAALELEDMAFTQYREPGILMWRDFGMQVLFVCGCLCVCVSYEDRKSWREEEDISIAHCWR